METPGNPVKHSAQCKKWLLLIPQVYFAMENIPTELRIKDNNLNWKLFGRDMSRSAVAFLSQVIILYICILNHFVNLSIQNGPSKLWISLLSLSLGSMLPSPKVKKPLNIGIPTPRHSPTPSIM